MSELALQGASAVIEGRYRYRLTREWGNGPRVCFIMLNPSTADAQQDDPTIRKCVHFAKAIGGGSIEVVNLFALRATDPHELLHDPEPIGPANAAHVQIAAISASTVICAWGASTFARERARETLAMLRAHPVRPMCMRRNKDGSPAHPLYLPNRLRPIPLDAA